jgi:hypothetical protein
MARRIVDAVTTLSVIIVRIVPVVVLNSSIPRRVITNFRVGTLWGAKSPPDLVSRNEMLVATTVSLRMSPALP